MSKSLFLPIVALAWLLAGGAAADDLTANISAASGTCRDTFTGEAETTQSASLEYRHESEQLSIRGYGRVAPAGGNCAETAYTHDVSVDRRFEIREGLYGVLSLSASQYAQVGTYRYAEPGLVLFANEADGSPAYGAFGGVEYRRGPWSARALINVARNDYVDDSPFSANSGLVGIGYSRDLIGGVLEAEFEVEGPRFDVITNSLNVRWAREISNIFDLVLSYRRRGGLDSQASPFAPSVVRDGREYAFLQSDPTISTFEIGIAARF